MTEARAPSAPNDSTRTRYRPAGAFVPSSLLPSHSRIMRHGDRDRGGRNIVGLVLGLDGDRVDAAVLVIAIALCAHRDVVPVHNDGIPIADRLVAGDGDLGR